MTVTHRKPLTIALLTTCLAFAAVSASRSASAGTYVVDPIHSSLLAKVRHAGATNFYARFNKVEGTLVTSADGAIESINLSADVKSIDTHNKQRDEHLLSAEFFDAGRFPTVTFKSTAAKKTESGFEITGDFSLHGVTKPITAVVTQTGTGTNVQGRAISGFETEFKFNRSDFGMTNYPQMVGDEVTLIVSLEGIDQTPEVVAETGSETPATQPTETTTTATPDNPTTAPAVAPADGAIATPATKPTTEAPRTSPAGGDH